MNPGSQFLLYCQTGVYDCGGSISIGQACVIVGAVAIAIGALALLVWWGTK